MMQIEIGLLAKGRACSGQRRGRPEGSNPGLARPRASWWGGVVALVGRWQRLWWGGEGRNKRGRSGGRLCSPATVPGWPAGRSSYQQSHCTPRHRGPAAPIATSQSATLHREERGYTTTERGGGEGRGGGGGAGSRQRAHPWGRSGWTWLGESRKKRRKGTATDEVRGTETTMIRLEGNSGAWGSQLFFFNRRGIPSVLDISRSSTCICLLLQIYMHTIDRSVSMFFLLLEVGFASVCIF